MNFVENTFPHTSYVYALPDSSSTFQNQYNFANHVVGTKLALDSQVKGSLSKPPPQAETPLNAIEVEGPISNSQALLTNPTDIDYSLGRSAITTSGPGDVNLGLSLNPEPSA